MAVSDLTGTTWIINSSVSWWSSISYSSRHFIINFTSNEQSNTRFAFENVNADDEYFVIYYYPSTNYWSSSVFNSGNYPPTTLSFVNQNSAYCTITITGGTDATNSDLIAWLEANAVQQVPTVDTTSSFSDIALTSHEGYITLTIDNVDFNINAAEVVNNNEEVNLILFKLNETPYQAEDGMTWVQWVDSAYNTDGYTISGDYIVNQLNYRVFYSGSPVGKSDTIVSNRLYQVIFNGGGGSDR